MNARTGSMLACATSRGTLEFDINHCAELYDVYKREPNFFADPLITPMAPGSVMKLITASVMLKNGVDMVYYDDIKGFTIEVKVDVVSTDGYSSSSDAFKKLD